MNSYSFTDIIEEIKFAQILQRGKDKRAPIAEEFDIDAQFVDIDLAELIFKFETKDLGPQGSGDIHDTWFQINKRKDPQRWEKGQNLQKIAKNPSALRAFIVAGFFTAGETNYWCSCDSFNFGGFKFLSTKEKNNFEDEVESRHPVERNPQLYGISCKHVLGTAVYLDKFYTQIVNNLQQQLQKAKTPTKTPGKKQPITKKKKEQTIDNWITLNVNINDINVKNWLKKMQALQSNG